MTANFRDVMELIGLIVMIRTFLSMTLQLEVEGRWSWAAATGSGAGRAGPLTSVSSRSVASSFPSLPHPPPT